MKNLFSKFIITILFCLPNLSKAQNFSWANSFGGIGSERGNSIITDANSNVYSIGYFNSTTDFDSGTGVYALTPSGGGAYDAYISRLDASGNFIWARSIGGPSDDFGQSLALDGTGKVVCAGYFSGTSDFDPGLGSYTLSSAGGSDIFITKLNASGNFVWSKSLGGTGEDVVNAISTDASNNILSTGFFHASADFDPGTGTLTLASLGAKDIFISKLDAAGNFVWAKSIGSTANDVANSIVTDATGNIFVTGYFNGTVDFDPGAGTYTLASAGIEDIFILKLDASGNFVWAKSIGAVDGDGGKDIALDAGGNIFTIGNFEGPADFDPGAGIFNLNKAGCFILKLDQSGNFMWANELEDVDGPESIAIDGSGNLLNTGYYDNTIDFDPGTGTFNLTAAGALDVFIMKLDNNGNFIWAKGMGGSSGGDVSSSITTDVGNNVLATGQFEGTSDYDPDGGVYNLISNGSYDSFILKLSTDVGIKENSGTIDNSVFVYPNPNNGTFKLYISDHSEFPKSISVIDLFGRTVLSLDKINLFDYDLNLGNTSGGLFTVRINYENRFITKRVILN